MTVLSDGWLDELAELLRIPSVSAEPEHAADVRRAALWVRDFVRRAGGGAELAGDRDGELVVGEIPASTGPDAPTVLVYGHYDVQPAAPLALWESDPFEPSVRGDWLYARGVADDKGQLFMQLKAAELLARERALPVNLRIVCDGEEESGGDAVCRFLRADERGADASVIFDGWTKRRHVPELVVATRGLVALDLDVRAGERDLHSGHYGGVALNASHALVRALAALLPREGRLPEPLRAGVVPPDREELRSWADMPPGEGELLKVGAAPLDERAAEDFYMRAWAEPSLDVNGIVAGKPGVRNTTVVSRASAQLTIRIVPGQEVEAVAEAAVDLLRAALPPGAKLEARWEGVPPAVVPAGTEAVRIASRALEHVFGRPPLLVRCGGTLPVLAVLAERRIPTVMAGFALPESNTHSPNERLLLDSLRTGVAAARALYVGLGALPAGRRREGAA